VSNRQIIGLAVAACVACCIGPILGVLGAIIALGVVSSVFIGLAGLLIATAAVAASVLVRRRRGDSCRVRAGAVPVELRQRS
jgi:hypothetical protein